MNFAQANSVRGWVGRLLSPQTTAFSRASRTARERELDKSETERVQRNIRVLRRSIEFKEARSIDDFDPAIISQYVESSRARTAGGCSGTSASEGREA